MTPNITLYDATGTRLCNEYIVDLGNVDADSLSIMSLFAVNSNIIVVRKSNDINFFELQKDEDDNDNIKLLDANSVAIDAPESGSVIQMCLNTGGLSGEWRGNIEVFAKDNLQTLMSINFVANIINVDERLKVMMSNFNRDWLEAYNDAILQNDNRQDFVSAMLQNVKMREYIIRRDEYENRLGTYSGLLNILDFFGYTNAVNIYEILKSKQHVSNANDAEQTSTMKMYIELGTSMQTFADNWIRTNLLALVYRYNWVTDEWCAKCTQMPVIKPNDTQPNQDLLKKLNALIKVLDYEFLPEHIHFEDIQIDVIVAYIAVLTYASQKSSVNTVMPDSPGVDITVKDAYEIVNGHTDDDLLTDDETVTAWIRPVTFFIDAETDMTDALGKPLQVFIASNIGTFDSQIDDKPNDLETSYIDWWLKYNAGEIPAYLKFDKHEIYSDHNAFSEDLLIMSNAEWELQTLQTDTNNLKVTRKAARQLQMIDNLIVKI